MVLTQSEKVVICTNIANNLKNYRLKNGSTIDLFQDQYTFIPPLKKLFSDYIHGATEFKGTLQFEEINKSIDYLLPIDRVDKQLFVIRIRKKQVVR
jgi:hypothetical protein